MKHVFKFTHIVAVVFAAVTVFGFSACNDEVGDNMSDLKTVQTALEEDVQDLQEKVDELDTEIALLQTQMGSLCDECFQKHFPEVVDLVADSLKNYWNITDVQNYVTGELNKYTTLTLFWAARDTIHNALNDIRTQLRQDSTDIATLYGMYTTLNTAVTNAHALAQEALNLAKADSARIDTLANHVGNVDNRLTTAEGNITTLTGNVSTLTTDVATLGGRITTVNGRVDSLAGVTNTLGGQITTLGGQINTVNGRVDSLAGVTTGLGSQITTINGQITTINGQISTINTTLSTITTTVNGLTTRVSKFEGDIAGIRDTAATALAMAIRDSIRIMAMDTILTKLQNDFNKNIHLDSVQQYQIDSLKNIVHDFATNTRVDTVVQYAEKLYNKSLAYSDTIFNRVCDSLRTYDARITTLETLVPIVNTIKARVDTLYSLYDSVADLRSELQALKMRMDTIANDVADLMRFKHQVQDVFKKTIYSVVLQGSYNPVFGYFAMPVGVQSNILMAYYGSNDLDVYFPTRRTTNLVYDTEALTQKDVDMINLSNSSVLDSYFEPSQTTFLTDGANAGKLFFSVNPNGVDLSTAEFTLVNSINEEAGITLDTVKPSTEKLTFGYTGNYNRAPVVGQSANGFYEAAAKLDEAGIPVAKIQIDSELKQAVKDFYNTNIKGKSGSEMISDFDVSSLTQLAQGLYQQFNGLMPAYALKATWTDSLGAHSVVSNYGAAAVAVKPLSYSFLKDKSMKKLPTISPINDLSGFNINMKNIDFNINFKIDTAQANIHLTGFHINLTGLYAQVSVPKYNPATGTTVDTIIVAELDSLEKTLNNYFNTQFDATIASWNVNINNEINQQVNALIKEINNQVNGFVGNIEGQLNTQIQNVVDDAQSQVMDKFNGYIHKVNNYISKVNRVINRFNKLLDNPNKFLQTILVYEGADKHFHIMSTSKAIPTVFTGSGAIVLHPTSFNAEIAAPAFKKFIAVTDVMKDGKSAKGDDPDCQNVLKNVNSGDFCKLLPGGRYGVAFVPTNGYTYEILYSALDYHGKISQRKYYVTVK